MTTATRKANILKPAVLTYAEVRALKMIGAAIYAKAWNGSGAIGVAAPVGRGDRVQVRYGNEWKTFKRQGGAWVAI